MALLLGRRGAVKSSPRTKDPHQVDGVEDLHLPDGRAAWIRQVTVVVVDRQRTQACDNTRGTNAGQILQVSPELVT